MPKAVTKKPQAKRSSRKRYALMLLRRYVLERDKFRCQLCGQFFAPEDLECAHIIGKQLGGARLNVAFEPDNCVAMCKWECHRTFDGIFDKWAWAEKRLGSQRWAELQEQGRQRWDSDYDGVIENLKALLKGVA